MNCNLCLPEDELEFDTAKPFLSNDNFELFRSDVACRKMALKKQSPKGVYLVEGVKKMCIIRPK